jgi:hypothetical protein
MLGEGGKALAKLNEAIREFQACEVRPVDLKGLREAIDELKYELFFLEWTSKNHRVRAVDRLERDRI